MAGSAETINSRFNTSHFGCFEIEDHVVTLVKELEFATDSSVKFHDWMGGLALNNEVELSDEAILNPGNTTLFRELKLFDKNEESKKMVRSNIAATTFEVCYKNGIRTVEVERGDDGKLYQFGQTMESVYANSFNLRNKRNPILESLTRAEALNGRYIEDAINSGELKDKFFVVASIVPEGVKEKELGHEGDGYFLDELTFCIQTTSINSEGKILIQSAFGAGTNAPEDASFEQKIEMRVDIKALGLVYESFGHKAPKTAEEFLSSALLVPLELMPNGILDFIRLVDLAKDVLSGESRPRPIEEYEQLVIESERKEKSLKNLNDLVENDLLVAMRSGHIMNDDQMVKLLWDRVKVHAVNEAIMNTNIDSGVFGQKASGPIDEARRLIELGRNDLAIDYIKLAQKYAQSTGCKGVNNSNEEDFLTAMEAGSDIFGSLVFTCSNGCINVREYMQLIPKCKKCGISVKCDPSVDEEVKDEPALNEPWLNKRITKERKSMFDYAQAA